MKKLKTIIAVLVFAIILPSCKSLVPYTNAIKEKYNWTNSDVKKLQFYVSNEIILLYDIKDGDTAEIIGGKIITVNGKKKHEVHIKAGTKGVLVQIPNSNKFLVSFEISDEYYLSFGANPGKGGKFYLLAENWKNGMGKVHYHDKTYYSGIESSKAILLVDKRDFMNLDYQHRVAKGRSVTK